MKIRYLGSYHDLLSDNLQVRLQDLTGLNPSKPSLPVTVVGTFQFSTDQEATSLCSRHSSRRENSHRPCPKFHECQPHPSQWWKNRRITAAQYCRKMPKLIRNAKACSSGGCPRRFATRSTPLFISTRFAFGNKRRHFPRPQIKIEPAPHGLALLRSCHQAHPGPLLF